MSGNSHSTATPTAAKPRKAPAQRRSRETVDRMLDVAARIFDECGYRATTTNHVAAAAGVSIGSLYQYFPNKDALLVALADRHLDEAMPLLAETAGELRRVDVDLDEALRRLIVAALDANRSDRLHQLLWTAPRTLELTARLEAAERVMVDEVAWHLERAGWPADDVLRRARLIVVAVEAAIHDRELASDPVALVDELVAMCLGH